MLRAATLLVVTAKLLVPLGYMPGALADGGPFVLCPAGLPPKFRVAYGIDTHPHTHAPHAAAPTSGTLDGAPDAPYGDEPYESRSSSAHLEIASETLGSAPTHDYAEGAAWERCALGGVGGFVPLTFVPVSLDGAPGTDAPPTYREPAPSRSAIAIVRSRGPPSRSC